ncbi:MAG: sulfite exporter TauE/SafE family protein [Armatimonadota bacterium]
MEVGAFSITLVLALAAGLIGGMLGLGGGIILVPGLTLLLGYDVKVAAAASLVTVIATSTASATVYVSQRLTNIRLGMLLEIATTLGALVGGVIAVYISGKYLFFIFAAVLIYAGTNMLRVQRSRSEPSSDEPLSALDSSYTDPMSGKIVDYRVKNVPAGMAGSLIAGIMSGMLGIGGGIIKVPLMNLIMRIPMRAAIATSNFMIGVTAAAGALVFWVNGKVDPAVAAPCVIGVLIGARLGTRVGSRVPSRALKIGFAIFVVITAAQMIQKGFSL